MRGTRDSAAGRVHNISAGVLAVLLAAASSPGAAAQAGPGAGVEPVGDVEDSLAVVQVDLADVSERLDTLQQRADDAIRAHTTQLEELGDAQEAHQSSASATHHAQHEHKKTRTDTVQYAILAYQGTDLSPAEAWTDVDGPDDVLTRSAHLDVVADGHNANLDRTHASRIALTTLRDRAGEAADERREATQDTEDAKTTALEALATKEDEKADLLAEQTELELQLVQQQDNSTELEDQRQTALEQAEAAPLITNPEPPEPDEPPTQAQRSQSECSGGDPSGYANGQLPQELLCPLPQAGERLRADAAAAFIDMDGAFREQFGHPMCVADSYRPLDDQVRLFHELQGGMAADPGTSAHGEGTAVDLCGGVENDESDEHGWLRDHAPEYGWHHPDWAGGGFEPWHWEYVGVE